MAEIWTGVTMKRELNAVSSLFLFHMWECQRTFVSIALCFKDKGLHLKGGFGGILSIPVLL